MSIDEIRERLAAPFDESEVKFKPAVVRDSRALALAYVDARVVMDRLDDVLGVGGWEATYQPIEAGVVCRLRARLGEQWVTHEDVGSYSEQPDEGDRVKAAFSDALKRAAVHLGVGRYLYRMPQVWCDYDAKKKQFTSRPQLPAPAGKPAAAQPKQQARPKQQQPASALPASGGELRDRLAAYDGRLAAQGLCRPGDLVRHVAQLGAAAGHPEDLADWSTAEAFQLAVNAVKVFEAEVRANPRPEKKPAPAKGETTAEQRAELAQLMKQARKVWADCQRLLRVGPEVGVADLTAAQAQRLRAALLEEAGQPAGA